MGRPFEIAKSNYVVTNYHTELLEMRIALDLANLNMSNYSLTLMTLVVLLKSNVTDQFTDYPFNSGSLQKDFTN